MTQPDATAQNGESGKALAKQSGKAATGNRFSAAYWQTRVFKPSYTRDNETATVDQYYARMMHSGERKAVPLATNNQDEAARQALKIYKTLKRDGWNAALTVARPGARPIDKTLTVGKYLEHVGELVPMPVRTFANYSYAIRRIAGDVAGLKMAKGARFDPKGRWKKTADEIPLGKLTPAVVDKWKLSFLKERKTDVIASQRAVRSVNSFLRNGRALFSKRVLKQMKLHSITLPDPLPFAGVALEPQEGSTRYRSTIQASDILAEARRDFAETNPDAYGMLLLSLGAGLRRQEIDTLQRQHLRRAEGRILVMVTIWKGTKSVTSERDVFVDDGVFAELERVVLRPGNTLYIIQPDTEYRRGKAAQYYRCKKTSAVVNPWLRKHGVAPEKPTQTMRKEFGSIVAADGDIFQAQQQLGHAQITTTAAYYADARKRATVKVGAMLNKKEAI